MANHLTPEELSAEVGIEREEVIRICIEEHVPIYQGKIDKTLFVNEDVKDHAEIDEAVELAEVKKPELDLAKQIIDSLAAPFDPEELKSEYRESLRQVLEAKLEGKEFEFPVEEEPAPVVDLMAALRASVAAATEKETAKKKKPAAARKRAAGSSRR